MYYGGQSRKKITTLTQLVSPLPACAAQVQPPAPHSRRDSGNGALPFVFFSPQQQAAAAAGGPPPRLRALSFDSVFKRAIQPLIGATPLPAAAAATMPPPAPAAGDTTLPPPPAPAGPSPRPGVLRSDGAAEAIMPRSPRRVAITTGPAANRDCPLQKASTAIDALMCTPPDVEDIGGKSHSSLSRQPSSPSLRRRRSLGTRPQQPHSPPRRHHHRPGTGAGGSPSTPISPASSCGSSLGASADATAAASSSPPSGGCGVACPAQQGTADSGAQAQQCGDACGESAEREPGSSSPCCWAAQGAPCPLATSARNLASQAAAGTLPGVVEQRRRNSASAAAGSSGGRLLLRYQQRAQEAAADFQQAAAAASGTQPRERRNSVDVLLPVAAAPERLPPQLRECAETAGSSGATRSMPPSCHCGGGGAGGAAGGCCEGGNTTTPGGVVERASFTEGRTEIAAPSPQPAAAASSGACYPPAPAAAAAAEEDAQKAAVTTPAGAEGDDAGAAEAQEQQEERLLVLSVDDDPVRSPPCAVPLCASASEHRHNQQRQSCFRVGGLASQSATHAVVLLAGSSASERLAPVSDQSRLLLRLLSSHLRLLRPPQINQMVASRQLALAGIDTVQRMSGQAALDYLSTCEALLPDAILMDFSMPEMSGAACTARIRALLPSRAIPVVVLSADATEAAMSAAFAAGASDYVQKPFRREELAARLRTLVRDSGAQRASCSGATTTPGEGVRHQRGDEGVKKERHQGMDEAAAGAAGGGD